MPSLTRCVCKDNPFIHFVYGNQNQVAQAVTVVRNGTVGRIIELPIDLLAQSAALFCPYRSHKLDGVRFRLCKSIAFQEGMLALPYR